MNKRGILLAITLTALLATGCGNKKEPAKTFEAETSTPAETTTEPKAGNQELPNPMMEVEDVPAFEAIDIHMVLPEGAEDTSLFIINREVADAQFILDGVAYTYRVSDTTGNFAGIFERFEDEAVAQNYGYDGTSLEILIRTTDSGGRLASREWGSTKYTLYTAAQVDDEAIMDLTMDLVELSQYGK